MRKSIIALFEVKDHIDFFYDEPPFNKAFTVLFDVLSILECVNQELDLEVNEI